jgi:biopolymer transport protein TolQ
MNAKLASSHLSTWSLISDAGPLVKFILVLLLAASVITWAVILLKWRLIKSSTEQNRGFVDFFWSSSSLDEIHQKLEIFPRSQVARVFSSGYRELRKLPVTNGSPEGTPEIANITRAMNRTHSIEVEELEKYVDWLASTASAAPFVGLFGTVWGIMGSFQSIGAMGSASLAVVAPGISEALIATAMGLAAAIPAAIAYNTLVNRIKKISLDVESFSQEYLNMIQRSLLSNKVGVSAHGPESRANI